MTNQKPKISIIIPVFNQEQYIEECFNSIINQSFSDFEVVVVDDGSTDKTFDIFNSKFAKDARFKVISYNKNKGTSQARKDAVLASKGEYLIFVDPDDTLHKDALKLAVKAVEKEKVDMLQFGTNVIDCGVNPTALSVFVRNCEPCGERLERDTLFFACFEEKLFNFNLWNKIYNGNMARKAFSFVKDGYYPKAQDFYGFALMAFFSKTYASIDAKLYNYYYGRGITGKRSISLDRFYKVSTQMHIIEQLYKFVDDQKVKDAEHFTSVLKYRGQIFFNEVFANFNNIEDFDLQIEPAIEHFLNGLMPVTKEKDFLNKNVFNAYLDALFSYVDCFYYEKNLDYNQMIFDWAFNLIESENYKDVNSYLFKEVSKLLQVRQTKKKVIPVVFATNNNYAPYLGVSIESLKQNASDEYVYDVYVFHTALSDLNQMKLKSLSENNVFVRCVNVIPQVKNLRDYSHSHYSVEMYYRILIPEILKQYDKVVYLDCDLVLNTDVANLFNIDLKNNIVAAVINDITSGYMKTYLDQTLDIPENEYFNSGVLLINTKEFRNNDIKNQCFEFLNKFQKLMCPDQDILNLSCRGKVLYLDKIWNFQVGSGGYSLNEKYLNQYNIVHYTSGDKPWNKEALELGEIFWKYAKTSIFYESILSVYLASTLKIEANSNFSKQRNIINLGHRKKCLLTWPFRMVGKFFNSLSMYGLKATIKQVGVKLKYVFGRLLGKVDLYNNPINKNKHPQVVKDYQYYLNLPVKNYGKELQEWYNNKTNSKMDINNPQTFNEKIQWLKIYDATLIKSHLSDKYLAKEYIKATLGEEYIIKTLGVYDKFEDIDFDVLPDRFVIKSTHGSGQVIIVKDKSTINKEEIKAKTEKWLRINFAYTCGLEVHYHNMIPRIIIEEYMENIADDLYDYKIMCVNGKVELLWVDSNRFVCHQRNVYDKNWNPIHEEIAFPENPDGIPKPKCLSKLISIAEKLAKDFSCVRCDFYVLSDNSIKFGELTFTSGSGFADWKPYSYFDKMLGEKIMLPQKTEFKKLSREEILKSETEFLESLKGDK